MFVGSSITLSMLGCTVSSSTARTGGSYTDESYGAGLFMGSNGDLHIEGSTFTTNRAYQGSGVYLSSGTVALIEDSAFNSNSHYGYRTSSSSSSYWSSRYRSYGN